MKRCIGVASLLFLLAGPLHAQPQFLYVNNDPSGPNAVSAFSVTGAGALVPLPGSPYPTGGVGSPGGFFATNRITACVVGNLLFVANDGSDNVTVFSINPVSGALTIVPGSPFPTGGFAGSGISLGATPDNRFLYATSAGSQDVAAFQIAGNGALTPIPGSPFALPASPDGIRVTPDGKFLIVAMPDVHGVGVLSLAANGTPSSIPGSPFPGGSGFPTGVDADCAEMFAFVAEANSDRTIIDVYSRLSSGALSPIPGSPFSFFSGANSNVPVLSPDDKFLFVSNQNSNTVTVLNVASNGSLTLVSGSPFADPGAQTPTLMATNQAGTLLYVSNFNNSISVFRIAANGSLSLVPGSPFPGGAGISAVAAFPSKTCERCDASNQAPAFVPPTPTCGSTVDAVVGAALSFDVSASDPDSGDVVTLAVVGLPSGATLTPPAPVTGNPATTHFDWTPVASDQGDHAITFTASDRCGHSTDCTLTIHVTNNRNPICDSAVASESVLWPPNHRYHAISILGVTDPDGDPVTITVTGVTQDEPVNTRGDGNTCPEAQIVDGQASVRAERTGTPGIPGNGRVYAITFTADDGRGGHCTSAVHVCVARDQGDLTCVDDGQRFNSLGPCTVSHDLGVEVVSLDVDGVTDTQAQLRFGLPADAHVDVSAFDVAGRRLATIEDGQLSKGVYERAWNMGGVSNGLYFVRLRADGVILTRTLLKIR